MQALNIQSLIDAKKDLNDSTFQAYIRAFGLNPRIRPAELADIAILVSELKMLGATTDHFNEFFIGYSISQISKEFDLLRIGHNFILNIELKFESSIDRIQTQLQQNAYYLRFLNKPVVNFTFVSSSRKLYKLENNKVHEVSLQELFNYLTTQHFLYNIPIDDLFDPIHYLVSPLEEPLAFLNDEYFLTAQQTTFKMEILNTPTHRKNWFAIEGGPGTGKTLLTYDLAKHYISSGKKVVILHSSPLVEGQMELKSHVGWNIRYVDEWLFEEACDVLIMDEAHNFKEVHLKALLNYAEMMQPKVILSYDAQHFFDGSSFIQQLEQNVKLSCYELKVIIRFNEEIFNFINCLFDLNYVHSHREFKHITIQYFHSFACAKEYLTSLALQHWKIVNVLDSLQTEKKFITSDIIGQEFDQVAAVLDEHFYYKTNNRLSCYNLEYTKEQPAKVLYQTLTRTRKKLQLVIVNNEPLLKQILSILA